VRIEKLQQAFNVDVQLVHFPLHPDTPAEGRLMADFYASRGMDPHQMYLQMKARMDDEGLPYGERTHTYNSRLAQELGKWGDTIEGGEVLHDAFYRGYFVDRRNIGDTDVLLDIVKEQGLPVETAREVLEQRSFSDAVDTDWAKSRQAGVTGVPTFVVGGYSVVGAQPYEVLEQLMGEVGAAPKHPG
jgi:predicted DsbA family dithiol-disulfide isomerase